jgi:integrase
MVSSAHRRAGTLRERAPGHWELRAFLGRDPISGKPRQATRTFVGSGRAAAKELSNLVAEAEAGRFDRSTATLGQLLDKWLEFAEMTQRHRTLYENRRKIETRIRPALGSVRLSKLHAQTFDAAYGHWLDEGLSASTVNK